MFQYLISRLTERSTWAGLVAMATAYGISFTENQANAVIALGLAVVGALFAFTKDKK